MISAGNNNNSNMDPILNAHFRHCLLYEFNMGFTPRVAHEHITKVYGQLALTEDHCECYFATFSSIENEENCSTSEIPRNEPRALHNQLVQIKEEPMGFGERPEQTASTSFTANMEVEPTTHQQQLWRSAIQLSHGLPSHDSANLVQNHEQRERTQGTQGHHIPRFSLNDQQQQLHQQAMKNVKQRHAEHKEKFALALFSLKNRNALEFDKLVRYERTACEFLIEHGLLKVPTCGLGEMMRITSKGYKGANHNQQQVLYFKCQKRHKCNPRTQVLRKDTWLHRSRLSCVTVLRLMYTWTLDRYTIDYCSRTLGVSKCVAYNWREYFRKMCAPSVPMKDGDWGGNCGRGGRTGC